MALVLSVHHGEDFFVGDEQFIVTDVSDETSFKVRLASTGVVYDITDSRSCEPIPGVYISAGDRPPSLLARVVIDAPRSVPIATGRNYRKAL